MAIALGEPDGLIKTIINKDSGAILGVHMIGTEVTELINSVSLAMTLECTEEYALRTIFPHPTLSEMIHGLTLAALNRPVHI